MTLEFTVEQKENGMLLRDFLRKRGVSAALAKGVKASNGFFRDGAPVHTDMRLSAGQRISFALPPEPPTEVLPQALPLDILYEDEDILVLNKPADMPVHPSAGNYENTLANGVAWYYKQQGKAFVYRCINRLDADTSGLIIVAKNMLSAALLGKVIAHLDRNIERHIESGLCAGIEGAEAHPIGELGGLIGASCEQFAAVGSLDAERHLLEKLLRALVCAE